MAASSGQRMIVFYNSTNTLNLSGRHGAVEESSSSGTGALGSNPGTDCIKKDPKQVSTCEGDRVRG